LDLANRLENNLDAAQKVFRLAAFNLYAQNADDHTKNFAFRLKKDEKWELTPAYDICHAYRPGSEWVSQHALSINNKRNNISKDDLLVIGESIKCKKSTSIISEINQTISQWPKFAADVQVSTELTESIEKTLLSIK
jgi:serine/threonine-protein kinase HipA